MFVLIQYQVKYEASINNTDSDTFYISYIYGAQNVGVSVSERAALFTQCLHLRALTQTPQVNLKMN